MVLDPFAVTFALSAGALTFFSPCSVALIPAYVGYFLGLDTDAEPEPPSTKHALRQGARFSTAAAAGILALFALGSLLVFLIRRSIRLETTVLADAVVWLGLLIGALLAALGILMLLDVPLEASLPLPSPNERTLPSMFAFGALFAAGSIGCSLPLFFAMTVQALSQSPLGALVTFAAYGIGLAGLLVLTGMGLALARDQAHQRLRRIVPYFRPLAGGVLILAGIYTAVYYATFLG